MGFKFTPEHFGNRFMMDAPMAADIANTKINEIIEPILLQIQEWAAYYRQHWEQAIERGDSDVSLCCARMIAAEDIANDLKQRNKP